MVSELTLCIIYLRLAWTGQSLRPSKKATRRDPYGSKQAVDKYGIIKQVSDSSAKKGSTHRRPCIAETVPVHIQNARGRCSASNDHCNASRVVDARFESIISGENTRRVVNAVRY